MKYVKPELDITLFTLNMSVAATSCNSDYIGSVTTYPAQTVTCLNGTNDVIFNSADAGCEMFFEGAVYMEGGTYSSKDAAIVAIGQASGAISSSKAGGGGHGGSYTLAPGFYAYWVDSRGNDHAGLATSLDQDQYTNSF